MNTHPAARISAILLFSLLTWLAPHPANLANGPLPATAWVQSGVLTASDGAANNQFGQSVAIDGGVVVVGAPYYNGSRGMAAVFLQLASGWGDMSETARLVASDSAVDDQFGWSVAISGDTIIVGSPNSRGGKGAVYVFVKPDEGWTGVVNQAAILTDSTGAADDEFGFSVAIDGDTIIVGAPYNHDLAGKVEVFGKPEEGWQGNLSETAQLTVSGTARPDQFGYSVAINGATAAVGAIGHGSFQGAAYVFEQPAGGWSGSVSQAASLSVSSGAAFDLFGASIDTTGDMVVVGAPFNTISRGLAAVFVRPPGGWSGALTETAVLKDTDAVDGEQVGQSVAINGDTVIVGTLVTNQAITFVRPAGGWSGTPVPAYKLAPSDGVAGDQFGQSVAIKGGIAVIGANSATVGFHANQGKAYIFIAQYPLHIYLPAIQR